jgi:GDP-6-deoxy-D-talose 4-dehydrogenase
LKILLTGAIGFTGEHFSRTAIARGHEIVASAADLTDAAALQQEVIVTAPEWVVHLAAISFVAHSDNAAFYAVNTVGTTNLLQALASLKVPPQKVLLASSANIYGNCVSSPIPETQLPAPVNHYAVSKLAMELMAKTFADRLPIVVTRPFNYTGVGQAPQFVIPKLVDAFARKSSHVKLGNTAVEREFNDVRLLCDAYLALLAHAPAGETYNICSGEAYSLDAVIGTLSALTNHPIETVVDSALVRANEVIRLCGDPSKLIALFKQHGLEFPHYSLRDTLSRMLAAKPD